MPAIVDSSGWIEYFIDGPNANSFAAAIENIGDLIVPALTMAGTWFGVMPAIFNLTNQPHSAKTGACRCSNY